MIPELIIEDLRAHVKNFTQDGDKGLIFAGPDDGPLRNTNFNRRVWAQALKDADLPKIHFHDLRHTGNTLAPNAGASIRELMERMGHSKHAGRDALSALDVRAAAGGGTDRPWGTWEGIGHATGTGAKEGRMKIKAQVTATVPDLGFFVSERKWSLGDSNS
ncbi:tyrosine-type recombinase/integrase [Streptosporangium amethystogenes subsp. fukuiense]|uniref:Tyrosine-type recombinase/integrase n=1 Tax=Streptosporangium amethystogenes subsp. fukuiense TaxID=698418 RepID=A0ABW2T9W3_9ACTN